MVAGVVVSLYDVALALDVQLPVTDVKLAMVILLIAETAAAGVIDPTVVPVPPKPRGTIDRTVNVYAVPPVRPVNVYGELADV